MITHKFRRQLNCRLNPVVIPTLWRANLTLKGRPPFRLAGIEIFARLQEVVECTRELIEHFPEPRLLKLLDGLQIALLANRPAYAELSQSAQWLTDLADTLDPDGKPTRTAEQVQTD